MTVLELLVKCWDSRVFGGEKSKFQSDKIVAWRKKGFNNDFTGSVQHFTGSVSPQPQVLVWFCSFFNVNSCLEVSFFYVTRNSRAENACEPFRAVSLFLAFCWEEKPGKNVLIVSIWECCEGAQSGTNP